MSDTDDFVSLLVDACKTYADEIVDKVEKEVDKVSREALHEVKEKAPVSNTIYKKGGTYQRSWKRQLTKDSSGINARIYASGKSGHLTHLLELGHLNRDGTTRTKAIPHIAIASENAEKKIDKFIEEL